MLSEQNTQLNRNGHEMKPANIEFEVTDRRNFPAIVEAEESDQDPPVVIILNEQKGGGELARLGKIAKKAGSLSAKVVIRSAEFSGVALLFVLHYSLVLLSWGVSLFASGTEEAIRASGMKTEIRPPRYAKPQRKVKVQNNINAFDQSTVIVNNYING
jgi:hypothetical protein